MSHFTVLVVSDKKPTKDVLEELMMPYHEYECTGIEKYVEDVDETDDVIATFNEPVKVIRIDDPNGFKYFDYYDDRFYVRETPSKRVRTIPEGAVVEKIPAELARELGVAHYATLAECATKYYGAFERDGRFYRRTNPNKKWDWYQVGGRWHGMLLAKNGAGEEGKPAWMLEPGDKYRPNGVDICQVQDLDFEAMEAEAEKAAAKKYDRMIEIIAGRDFLTSEEVAKKYGEGEHDKIREEYRAQPVIQDILEDDDLRMEVIFGRLENFRMPREEYLDRARRSCFATFAVLKDGNWYEKGKMGWWGVVTDEKDADVWAEQFSSLIKNLSPETWLAVVDCHI